MDLAIIISVHNQNNQRLMNCVKTFLYQETTHSYGIYVVDYNSTDGLKEALQSLGSDNVFYLAVNKGTDFSVSHANNIAIKGVEADIVCMVNSYSIVPMQTIEFLCTETKDDTLLVYLRKPYFVPEPIWQDPAMTPADYERFRVAPTDWLDQNLHIGIGPHKKMLFAAKRQRIIEIAGYDEDLLYDEETDITRRLLQHGCVLTDLSQLIDVAYQPSTEDWEAKTIMGPLKVQDVHRGERTSAYKRKDPIRNWNREWGVI
jgi:glycosyltransferase involved in cell wall biosynthesis